MVKSSPPAPGDGGSNNNNNNAEVKYRGVRKRKWGKYVSEIRLPNSRDRIWLGTYDTAEKAARAFDAAQFCLRGHHGAFNFPDDLPDVAHGKSLSPDEIQDVAYRYANRHVDGEGGQEGCDENRGRVDGELDRTGSIDWSVFESLGDDVVSGLGVLCESDMEVVTSLGHHPWPWVCDEYYNFQEVDTIQLWNFS